MPLSSPASTPRFSRAPAGPFDKPAQTRVAPASERERAFEELAKNGSAQELADAMRQSPEANPSLAACAAAKLGRRDTLRVALSAFDAEDFHPMAMALALKGRHVDCVKELARRSFSEDQCDAFRIAAIEGDPACVAVFLEVGCDPLTPYSNDFPNLGFMSPLQWVAARESGSTLIDLIAHSLPHPLSAEQAERVGVALITAAENDNAGAIEALFQLSPPRHQALALEAALDGESLSMVINIIDRLGLDAVNDFEHGVARVILEALADPWAPSYQGRSERDEDNDGRALSHDQLSQALARAVERGFHPGPLDESGLTAHQWALKNHPELASLLLCCLERSELSDNLKAARGAAPLKAHL